MATLRPTPGVVRKQGKRPAKASPPLPPDQDSAFPSGSGRFSLGVLTRTAMVIIVTLSDSVP